ncbi:hypothetical protein MAFF241648_21480 [Ralstonia solanacearum]|nr:hypothetical protein MAFF241648_21480 [Ralstonia solanacearum]
MSNTQTLEIPKEPYKPFGKRFYSIVVPLTVAALSAVAILSILSTQVQTGTDERFAEQTAIDAAFVKYLGAHPELKNDFNGKKLYSQVHKQHFDAFLKEYQTINH